MKMTEKPFFCMAQTGIFSMKIPGEIGIFREKRHFIRKRAFQKWTAGAKGKKRFLKMNTGKPALQDRSLALHDNS